MKTDDDTKFRWLDDDLEAEEAIAFESRRSSLVPELEEREQLRELKRLLIDGIDSSQDPPYAEFFNSRILTQIRNRDRSRSSARINRTAWVKRAGMAAAACLALSIAFWSGTRIRGSATVVAEVNVEGAPKAIPVDVLVYSPVTGVEPEHYSNEKATVIVLNGVPSIPDSVDFSSTASLDTIDEKHATVRVKISETRFETP